MDSEVWFLRNREIFYKGTNSKYFRFCGPSASVSTTQICHSRKAATDRRTQYRGCEFHMTFSCLLKKLLLLLFVFGKSMRLSGFGPRAMVCYSLTRSIKTVLFLEFH